MTWYQHAVAYAAMKWPSLAAHSRASLAEALATVTPALTGPAPGRPSATVLQTALYRYAFNPARAAAADEATARVLAWTEKTSLPVTRLADPLVLRQALDALTLRLDGRRAAANTITRKRAAFHGARGHAGQRPLWAPVIMAARSSGCRNDGGGGGPQAYRPRAPSRSSGVHSWSSMMQSMSL